MITWTQFAVRRRVSLERFVGGLPDTAEATISARLVELGVDPKTFPWHTLAAASEAVTAVVDTAPVPADPQPDDPPPPEALDG